MIEQRAEIINKLGLHARAASALVQTISAFESEVFIEKSGQRINAKSIMGVMMLAAGKGSELIIQTEGADEQETMSAITALISDYFGEGE